MNISITITLLIYKINPAKVIADYKKIPAKKTIMTQQLHLSIRVAASQSAEKKKLIMDSGGFEPPASRNLEAIVSG